MDGFSADGEVPTGTSMLTSLTYTHRGGYFESSRTPSRTLTRNELSWRISDHYPLWVEFDIQPS